MQAKFQYAAETAVFKEMSLTEVDKAEGLNAANEGLMLTFVVTWQGMETRKDNFEELLLLRDVVMEEPLVRIDSCFKDVAKELHQHASSSTLHNLIAMGHTGIYSRGNHAF